MSVSSSLSLTFLAASFSFIAHSASSTVSALSRDAFLLTSVVVKPFRNTTTYLTDEIASLTEKKEIELTIFSIRLIIISTIAHNSNFCFISQNVCFFIFLIHFCYECLFI